MIKFDGNLLSARDGNLELGTGFWVLQTKSQNEINKPVNKNRNWNRNNFKMQIMQMRRTDFMYNNNKKKSPKQQQKKFKTKKKQFFSFTIFDF